MIVAGLSFVACNCFITTNSWSSDNSKFPYGSPYPDVHITVKVFDPGAMKSAVYSIVSGDVEGEADFVSATDPKMGQLILHSKTSVLQSTVENMRAPYSGHVTTNIECSSRKYVKEQKFTFNSSSRLIFALASPRKIFGVCALEEVGYAGAYFAAYDQKKQKVVTIQLFKPLKDPKKIEESYNQLLKTLQKVLL